MNKDNYPYEPEFSFKRIIEGRKAEIAYLWSKKFVLIGVGLLGALAGVLYAWQKPITYTARLTFVVEESNGGGGGSLLSGLAGQFGFDIGGMGGTGGVLAGDNVQQLLKSTKMIKNTLLTPWTDSSEITMADEYVRTAELNEAWEKKYNDGKPLRFPAEGKYTRLQDSLLQVVIKRIAEQELAVGKPDKKMSFFEASVTTHNETFSQVFTKRLIDVATRFYIETKTQRQRNNVNRLQARADSIGRLLDRKTYSAAASNNIMLDANPAYPTAGVNVELKARDKIVLQTIYAEIVKNLEVSRTMLMQETPTFQVVDEPELPLKKNRLGYLKAIVYGGLLAGLVGIVVLLFRREV